MADPPAADAPEAAAALRAFARSAYRDSPLPPLFKERLFVSLSRFCPVKYSVTRHAGFLLGLGRPAAQPQTVEAVVALLSREFPHGVALQPLLSRLEDEPPAGPPPAGSPREDAVFACAAHVFLQTADAADALAALRRAFDPTAMQHLLAFLAYVHTAHFWTAVQDGLRVGDDVEQLLRAHPRLAAKLADTPATGDDEARERLATDLAARTRERDHHAEQARVERGLRQSEEANHRRTRGQRTGQVDRLEQVNAELAAARRAALNVMEDAILARDALRDREAWLRGQRAALETALNAAPLAASLGVLVETAAAALGGGTRAAFFRTDGDGRSLHHVVGMSAAYAAAVDGLRLGPESLAVGAGQPVLAADVTADPRWEPWRETAARFDYRGCWSFPVLSAAGQVVGAFAVYSRPPREATDRDRALAALLTGTASIIISHHAEADARRRAEAALRASEERQAFLLALADALRPLADPADIPATAGRLLGEHLAADRAYYVQLDEVAGTARVDRDYVRGGSPSLAGEHRVADFGWVIPPLRRGETLVTPDVTACPRVPAADRPTLAAVRIAAQINVPLVRGGRLVGALCVTEPAPRAWTAAEVEVVRETADRIWAAVERATAEAALRASEERYRLLFDSIDEGFCTIDLLYDAAGRPADYRFVEVNPAFEKHTGLTAAAGRTVRELVPGHDEHWFERYGRAVATGEPTRFEGYERELGRWFDVYAFRLGGPDSRRAAVLFQDVTTRKRTDAAVRASEGRQTFLLALSDALRPLSDPADVQRAATRLLGEHLRANRVGYAEDHADEATIAVHHNYTSGAAGLVGVYRYTDYGSHLLRQFRAGRTVVMADVAADPELTADERAALAAIQVGAMIDVPLVKAGRLMALLFVHAAAPRDWTPAEVKLVEEVAERTWAAVERAKAEAAVRASEGRLRAVAANLPSGAAFVVGPDLRYQLVGGRALAAAGFTPADLEGKTVAEALPPDVAAGHEANYRAALAGEPFRSEHAAHGRRFVTHGGPLRDAAGRVTGVLAVSYDITDLRRAEGRLQLALDAARMGIWTLDAATGSHTRDANLNRLLGLPAAETTHPFDEFLTHVHPADRAAVDAAFAASIAHARPLSAEFRIVRPDGGVRWLRDQGDVFGEAGRPQMAGACVDVTDRRTAEDAVRASEERLRLIVAGATDYAIFSLADDRAVTSWSPGAAAIFGYAEADILGRPADLLFTPEDRAAGAPPQEADTARRTGRAADERWHLRRDGSRFFASGVLTRLAAGGFVKVARDLTERKQMEDELRNARDTLEERVAERTAELAAVVDALETEMARRRELAQRLSAAQEEERQRVSRDLHDTVGQTHAALGMALRAAAAAVPPGAAADRVAYALGLAEGMGRELHDAAVRLRPTALDDLGLEAALRGLVDSCARQFGVQAELHADTGGRLPGEVETALYRVVQEALTNVARHAKATTVSVVVTRLDGAVTAVVEDDGVGFDPESAGGTRLGLRGMRERVTLLGGELLVESQPGHGTSVIARVPVAP